MRNAYTFLVEKSCGEETAMGDVGIVGRIILNKILKEVYGVIAWTGFMCPGHGLNTVIDSGLHIILKMSSPAEQPSAA
jgi:hypothetical protein